MQVTSQAHDVSQAHPGVSRKGAFPNQARLHHKGLLVQVVLQDGGAALLLDGAVLRDGVLLAPAHRLLVTRPGRHKLLPSQDGTPSGARQLCCGI